MKRLPITKKACTSPLHLDTDPPTTKKDYVGTFRGMKNEAVNLSATVTTKPGETKVIPAWRKVERMAKTAKEIKAITEFLKANPGIEAERGYKPKTITTEGEEDINFEEERQKTTAQEGDNIDTFYPWERRMQNRNVKIDKRNEKEEGAQNIRRTSKFAKQEAKNMGMSGKEARQVKKDIKHGKITDNVKKVLGDEGADLARSEYLKANWQGPISKAGKTQSKDNAAQTVAVSAMGQKQMGKNPALSTHYEYRGSGNPLDVRQKGGGYVQAPEGAKTVEEGKAEYEAKTLGKTQKNFGTSNRTKIGKSSFETPNFSESVTGKKEESSAMKMLKQNSPFQMKKKSC